MDQIKLNQLFISELKSEAAKTRRILKAVPYDKPMWKPHEKSMELGALTQHLVDMVRWVSLTLTTDELDFKKGYPAIPPFTNADDMIASLDALVDQALKDLEGADNTCLLGEWTLRSGDHVFFTRSRYDAIRDMVFNHIAHHRAQLGVYLRMLDVKLPGVYGPTADDK